MSLLFIKTLAISGTMILLGGIPLVSRGARKYSKLAFLLGTGALSGLLLFDLLPDVFHLGGSWSIGVMGGVWLAYSLIHLCHIDHHHAGDSETSEDSRLGVFLFLASMIAHCIASGMLLALSGDLGQGFEKTVFLALMAHKAYEALTVSSILIERLRARASMVICASLYALALPVGVGLSLVFRSSITPTVAVSITSLAVGTLLGCLMYDFLLPSLSHIRSRRHDAGWVALGLLATQLVMRML